MSSFTVKMAAGPLPPVRCGNRAKTQEPAAATVKRATILPQVRGHELRKLQTPKNTSTNVSRRDLALFLTAASLSGTTLSSPEPAEARISRGDIKKKILEQLKMLREKAGLSKPETEEKDKIAPPPPPPPPSGAENAIPLIPLPLLPGGDHKTVVDATLP